MIPYVKFHVNRLEHYISKLSFTSINESGIFRKSIERLFDSLRHSKKTLLIIGKVQSGKTRTFIGLTAKALDNYFDTVIVLTGTTKILHNQTIERFKHYFQDQLQTHLIDSDELYYHSGKKHIIFCLKHHSRVDDLAEAIKSSKRKYLIIDDESDQASLNSYNNINNFNSIFKISSTNNAINKLIRNNNRKYVQITATPAGHILTSNFDSFSPDYITTIPEHNNYIGNSHFFENNHSSTTIIPSINESNKYVYFKLFIHKYLNDAVRLTLENKDITNISGLINIHYLKIENIKNLNLCQRIINELKVEILNGGELGPNFFFTRDNIQEYKTLTIILNEIQITGVFGNEEFDETTYFKNFKYFILIGGVKLSRGFTVEGLITSLLSEDRKSKGNGDTIQQKARFFGSKKHISKYCHLFINDILYDAFKEYLGNENDIFDSIQEGISKENLLFQFTSETTNPCRKNIISDIKYSINKNKFYRLYFNSNTDEQTYNNLITNSNTINSIYNRHCYKRIETSKFYEIINKSIIQSPIQLSIFNYLLGILPEDEIHFFSLNELETSIRKREGKFSYQFNRYLPINPHQGPSTNYPGDRQILDNNRVTIHITYNLLHKIPESNSHTLCVLIKFNNS